MTDSRPLAVQGLCRDPFQAPERKSHVLQVQLEVASRRRRPAAIIIQFTALAIFTRVRKSDIRTFQNSNSRV